MKLFSCGNILVVRLLSSCDVGVIPHILSSHCMLIASDIETLEQDIVGRSVTLGITARYLNLSGEGWGLGFGPERFLGLGLDNIEKPNKIGRVNYKILGISDRYLSKVPDSPSWSWPVSVKVLVSSPW